MNVQVNELQSADNKSVVVESDVMACFTDEQWSSFETANVLFHDKMKSLSSMVGFIHEACDSVYPEDLVDSADGILLVVNEVLLVLMNDFDHLERLMYDAKVRGKS
jgi:hypothetical protein